MTNKAEENCPDRSTTICIGNGQAHIASHLTEEVSQTLNCMHDPMAIMCFQNTGQGWWNKSDVGATLRTPCGGDSTKANLVMEEASATHTETATAVDVYNQTADGDIASTVTAAAGGTNTSGPKVVTAVDCRNGTENPDVNGTLQAKEQGQNLNSNNVCRTGTVVRRLTPLECTRLQGFPDGWVNIGDWTDSKGKKHKDADSPKYKALGNSIALPFWGWLARRICAQYERPATMGSLFDGIGGFPLVFSQCGAYPVWASEIEEFPIAVTKRRFGED